MYNPADLRWPILISTMSQYYQCYYRIFRLNALIAIYGHSDHKKMDITIEFTSKIRSRKYITLMCLLLLPYMVTLITKQTSPLNSHRKIGPGHISYVPY